MLLVRPPATLNPPTWFWRTTFCCTARPPAFAPGTSSASWMNWRPLSGSAAIFSSVITVPWALLPGVTSDTWPVTCTDSLTAPTSRETGSVAACATWRRTVLLTYSLNPGRVTVTP